MLSCGTDYACRAGCNSKQPGVQNFPQIPPLDVCVVNQCETECGVSCGIVAGSGDVDAADECQACVATNNCPAAEACGRSLACTEIAQCFGAASPLQLQRRHARMGEDAGAALLQAVLAPAQGACRAQCGYGVNWWCLGAVDVPVAQSSQTVMTLTVATAEGVVLPGLTVRACFPTDYDCTKPLDTELTDANGVATLTVRGNLPGGDGFDGYFDVEPPPPADGGAPVIVPLLYFVNYPLGRATISSSAVAVIPSDLALAKSLGGVTGDDAGSSGDFVVIAFDCSLELAPGVAFQAQTSTGLNLDSQVRYINGSTVAAGTATDGQGIGFVLGVPAGVDVGVTETPVGPRPPGRNRSMRSPGRGRYRRSPSCRSNEEIANEAAATRRRLGAAHREPVAWSGAPPAADEDGRGRKERGRAPPRSSAKRLARGGEAAICAATSGRRDGGERRSRCAGDGDASGRAAA